MLDDLIDTGTARPAAQAGTEFSEIFGGARSHDLNVAVFSIAYPAAQFEFTGFTVDEPPEADPLHASANEKVKNHIYLTRKRALFQHIQSISTGLAALEGCDNVMASLIADRTASASE
jgi:hypothetical protein